MQDSKDVKIDVDKQPAAEPVHERPAFVLPPPITKFKDAWATKEFKDYVKKLTMVSVIFLLLITVMLAYVLGSLFKSGYRAHNFRILVVDLDHEALGNVLQPAYLPLKGDEFATLVFKSSDQYPTPEAIYDAVFHGHFWAAIYTTDGASEAIEYGLATAQNATEYNFDQAMAYVWNQAHYTSVVSDFLPEIIKAYISMVSTVYFRENSQLLYQTYLSGSTAPTTEQWRVFANPVAAQEINIQPTAQLESFLYNTIFTVIVILIMFFFVLGTHVMSAESQAYTKYSPDMTFIIRFGASLVASFIYSLFMTGNMWWFREGWGVNGVQFVLTWLVFTILMSNSYLFFDIVSCVIPVPLIPCVVLAWILTSVISTLVPMPFTPGFYHFMVAIPAFNAYNLLASIWSRGASPIAHRAVPILVAWWIILAIADYFLHKRKCDMFKRMGQARMDAQNKQVEKEVQRILIANAPDPTNTNSTGTEPGAVVAASVIDEPMQPEEIEDKRLRETQEDYNVITGDDYSLKSLSLHSKQ